METPLKKNVNTASLKNCKGSGLAIGHGCGHPAKYRKYGLGTACCYRPWALNTENGKTKLAKKKLKRSPLIAKKKSQKTPLLNQAETTRAAVHTHVKKRDKGKNCISCDKPWQSNFQAGHYLKSETYSSVRYDLENIHAQCPECNIHKFANLEGYNPGIRKRIGLPAFDKLITRATRFKKWTKEELKNVVLKLKKTEWAD